MKRVVAAAVCLLALCTQVPSASGLPFDSVRARLKILSLELDEAGEILKNADDDSAEVAMERARLALYRGDCDLAVATLQRPDLEEDEDEGAHLLGVALGCARSSAATMILRDDAKGVVVRFHDDEDRSLFPLIVDAAANIRETLAKELGSRLPEPLWIDLVRDQLALSAHSGLPEQAAKTTGTVAVAKWGRVMMISPRAAGNGYPWLDTLAHEMTHLVLSQATRERAPLWLQEGVAKRQETRWRKPTPFDATPSPDAVALHGIKKGLALPLTELGPSIAMLPSAEQAAVAFAEVHSFINFWVERNGADALPKLLTAIRDQAAGSKPEDAIESVSGVSLADWDTRWRAQLSTQPAPLPAEMAPGSEFENGAKLARLRRLGELLLERGHPHAARHELEPALALLPSESSVRCLLSRALWGEGEQIAAAEMVARADDIHYPSGRWWSLNDFFMLGDAVPDARYHALGYSPFDPPIPCHEMDEGEYPADPIHRAICMAAWRTPQE